MSVNYPYVYSEQCPDCDSELVAVVHLVHGTPRANGALIRRPLEPELVWMQACPHVLTDHDESPPD